MIKVSLITAIILGLASSIQSSAFQYNIKGSLKGYDRNVSVVTLQSVLDDSMMDSTRIEQDGSFKMTGTHNAATPVKVGVKEPIEGGVRTNFIAEFVLEPCDSIIINQDMRVIAGPLTNKYYSFTDSVTSIILKAKENKLGDKAKIDLLMPLCDNTIKDNINNVAGAMALLRCYNIYDPERWLEYYYQAPDRYRKSNNLKHIAEIFEGKLSSKTGASASDVKGVTVDSVSVCLKDFLNKGKITVIDFWAPWCGPCIQEIKSTLIPLYEKFGSDPRFQIIGISLVSGGYERSKSTVERLGMKWHQIIVTDESENPDGKYGFDAIPFVVVTDGTGKIIARDIRGKELTNLITKLLSE